MSGAEHRSLPEAAGRPTGVSEWALIRCDHRRRSLGTVPDPLSRALAELLERGSVGGEVASARAFLDELKAGGHWLMCTCRGGGGEPMLFPCRRTDSGTLFLRRQVGVAHDPRCVWHRLTAEERSEGGDGEIEPRRAHHGSPFLLRRPRLGAAAGASPVGRPGATTARRLPRLAPVLFGLLQRAGFDTVSPEEVLSRPGRLPVAADPKGHYRRLHRFDGETLGAQLAYRDVLCTWLPALPQHVDRLGRLRGCFPRLMRPQGLFWGVVDDLTSTGSRTEVAYAYGPPDARHAVVDELPIVVRMAGRARRGPYWLVAALGAAGDDPAAPFKVLDAYAHPAYSRSLLLPVDSDAERRTAAVVLDQLAWWQRRYGLRALLHKPWETIDLPGDGVAPPPDFVVSVPGRAAVVVETMGSLDDEYLERKRRTHELMRRIPGVVDVLEHDPTDPGDTHRLRRALNATVIAASDRRPRAAPRAAR
jgi:hypothetical protein